MKKLLNLLAATIVVSSATLTVVACGDDKSLITMIVPENPNDFWQELIDKAVAKADSSKYNVKYISSETNVDKEIKNTQDAVNAGSDGIIMGQVDPNNTTAPQYVVKNGIPLVGVNIPFKGELKDGEKPNSQYLQDGEKDTELLGKNIREELCKLGTIEKMDEEIQIFEIWGAPSYTSAVERHNGFKKGLKTGGLVDWVGGDKDDKVINGEGYNGNWDGPTANRIVTDKLSELLKANVLYAQNDGMARGALEALKKTEEGKKWLTPKRLGGDGGIIVGYDNDQVTKTDIPKWGEGEGLGTLKDERFWHQFASSYMDATKLGELSMEAVIKEIENGNINKEKNEKFVQPSETILAKEENRKKYYKNQ